VAALKYWAWLASARGVGAEAGRGLLEAFGTPERVYAAGRGEYERAGIVKKTQLAGLCDKSLDKCERALDTCARMGYTVVTFQDAGYPERLKNIYGPPMVLYVRGTLPDIDAQAVFAIVGTRRCTRYGLREAERVAHDITGRGLLVATGLALGVDSAAARGALRAGGRVVGVVGSGLDVVYPRENGELFDAVATSGAIISEYPPGTAAAPRHFPARNRIISGISVGVAVIEAPMRSGALITASHALDQGREVFAMPGNVDAASCAGSNALLREGAIPLINADDIASEYAPRFPGTIHTHDARSKAPARIRRRADTVPVPAPAIPAPDDRRGEPACPPSGDEKKAVDNRAAVEYIDLGAPGVDLTEPEARVARAVAKGSVHVDEVIAGCAMAAQDVLAALTMLEIRGIVVQARGKYFSLAPRDKA
jgi:DNA processing protein